MKISQFDTKLGPMIAIGDKDAIFLLEFEDKRGLEREIAQLKLVTNGEIISGNTEAIISIQSELKQYFDGKLNEFKTPLNPLGTTFQKLVWQELLRIPYGNTRSYSEQAARIGKPNAFRAVANANGANRIAIVIPCHRILNNNGGLGGYSAGIARKKMLLEHEKQYS